MNSEIADWAYRHDIPAAALAELDTILSPWQPSAPSAGQSEADTQARLRVTAGRDGWPLWRNNNVAAMDAEGRMIRAGLGNDSKRVSDAIKSSDLIGPCPIVVGPEHVGRRVAVFTAVEVKRPGWTEPENNRDRAQEKFLSLVRSLGGFAGFATHETHLRSITTWHD